MFRFLIVEDDAATASVLIRLIKLEFSPTPPDDCEPQVDAAPAVDMAKRLISEAKKPYHAVILDFKLPPHRLGDNTEIDETLCLSVRRAMPAALVGHITSYPDDKLIRNHIQRFHTERITSNAFALSKLDNDWTQKLLVNLKAFLYGRPIEERLDRMFGEESWGQPLLDGLATGALASGRERGQSSLTHDLADLWLDISAHWDDLDEQLQARIKRTFKLDTDSRPIKISLFCDPVVRSET